MAEKLTDMVRPPRSGSPFGMAFGPGRRTEMASKRHTPEQIVAKLRQVDVLTSQGSTVADAVRQIGVTEVAPRRAVEWGDLLQPA